MKYNKLMRIISIILVCVSMSMLPAQATDVSTEVSAMDHMNSAQKQRLNIVMQDKVDYLSDLADRTLSIKSTKLVQDFSGNQYIVTECSPTGYMIYSIQSGVFAEYAPESQSPYEGYDGNNLYYGGPTEYYFMEDNVFNHTITGEKILKSAQVQLAESTDKLSKYYMRISDQEVQEYIISGSGDYELDQAQKAASSSATYISGRYLIQNMRTESEMSYFGKNACGYIAASMLLLWHDYYKNSGFIDVNNSTGKSYTNSKKASDGKYYPVFNGNPSQYYNGQTFSFNIWRWHSPNGQADYINGNYSTSAGTVKTTVESYAKSKGITVTSLTEALPPTSGIITYLKSYNRPYILFGNLAKPSGSGRVNHAVLVYGYKDNSLLCHYGWSGYTTVYVSGVWGTGYAIRTNT